VKAGFLCQRVSLHEERFIRVFKNSGVQLVPIILNDSSQSKSENQKKCNGSLEFIFGGPLHLNHVIPDSYQHLPYIALSYAYDVLYEARVNILSKENVRRNLYRSRGLIVDCLAVKEFVKKKCKYKKPIIVVPWGLEKSSNKQYSKITTGESNNTKNRKRILSVRNLTHLHGVLDVIRGFSEAIKIDSNLNLTVVGEGPLKNELFHLISQLNLNDKVEFLGAQTEAQVNLLMLEADIYVSASIVDGTSVSLLQALAAGLPVILSNCGGNPEWVNRVDGSYLFEVGDWKMIGFLMSKNNIIKKFDRSLVIDKFANWDLNSRLIIDFCRSFI
jgi:glycosyltransferase involved in cell wall biosynthesis